MFAKIENDSIRIATSYEIINHVVIQNPSPEILINAGFEEPIIPELKNNEYLGELYFDGNIFTYKINKKVFPIVFQKKYHFTINTLLLLTEPYLLQRTLELSQRILPNNNEPNKPEWLDNGDSTTTIGFDEVLQQDGLMLKNFLGIILQEKQEDGSFQNANFDNLPTV